MFAKIQYFPLFWENGMKLSAAHFQHLENSIDDHLRDARAIALQGVHFGMLPYGIFQLRNAEGSRPGSVRVILEACQAILPGGYRVEILPDNIRQNQIPIEAPYTEFVPMQGVRYHVFLIVHEKEKAKAGMPETRPIRHPYLAPKYFLECISNDKLTRNPSLNRMKIGEWENGKPIAQYIPPSLTMQGSKQLWEWHQFFQNKLENIVQTALQVIEEYQKKDAARVLFCSQIVQFIRSSQGHFRLAIPSQSPLYFAAYFVDFAGLLQGLIEASDRDFVRNQLKDGQVQNIQVYIRNLLGLKNVPLEEMAAVITFIYQFVEATLLTLQTLKSREAPNLKVGQHL